MCSKFFTCWNNVENASLPLPTYGVVGETENGPIFPPGSRQVWSLSQIYFLLFKTRITGEKCFLQTHNQGLRQLYLTAGTLSVPRALQGSETEIRICLKQTNKIEFVARPGSWSICEHGPGPVGHIGDQHFLLLLWGRVQGVVEDPVELDPTLRVGLHLTLQGDRLRVGNSHHHRGRSTDG